LPQVTQANFELTAVIEVHTIDKYLIRIVVDGDGSDLQRLNRERGTGPCRGGHRYSKA
jgi:hypothetical protein